MRNDSSIKKYYHCSSSRHRAHHRRTTKSPFPRSGSTSDTRDPFVNRYPTHPVIRKACRPRKGQRIPIPRKRLYRCKETARASQRTNERAGGRASERAAPILAARQGRGRERGLIVDVTLRTLSAFRSSGAKGVCVCSCRVQAHPRATRYIDNTRTREASHGWRGGRRREETDTKRGRGREREIEKEGDERGKCIHAERADRGTERGKWKRVGGYRWRVAKRATRRGEEGGEDSLPCPSSTNDRHPPLLPFTVLPTSAPLHSLPTTGPLAPTPAAVLSPPSPHHPRHAGSR